MAAAARAWGTKGWSIAIGIGLSGHRGQAREGGARPAVAPSHRGGGTDPAGAAAAPDLTVITVAHDHARFIGTLLDSLEAERAHFSFEMIAVDNASRDASAAALGARPWVRLLRNQTRHGFAYNNNLAMRASRGRHLLLLNPDTEVRPGALRTIVAYLDAHPEVGICGPQLLFPDGAVQPSARRFPTAGWVLVRRTPLRFLIGSSATVRHHLMADADHEKAQSVDWLLGAALGVRREFLSSVGLLDEGFFLYVEDIDWAYRGRLAGWQVHYVPEARVVHHYQAEIDRALLSRRSWIHAQGMWRFFRKHMAPRFLRLRVSHERLTSAVP